MSRALKIALIALPWGLLVAVAFLSLSRGLDRWWDSTTTEHSLARQSFYADLAFDGCVRQDAVITQAEARNWPVHIMDEPLPWCHAPMGLANWVQVDISPPLPFSTEGENAAYIGFDASGCMARWDYANGAESTCPDH